MRDLRSRVPELVGRPHEAHAGSRPEHVDARPVADRRLWGSQGGIDGRVCPHRATENAIPGKTANPPVEMRGRKKSVSNRGWVRWLADGPVPSGPRGRGGAPGAPAWSDKGLSAEPSDVGRRARSRRPAPRGPPPGTGRRARPRPPRSAAPQRASPPRGPRGQRRSAGGAAPTALGRPRQRGPPSGRARGGGGRIPRSWTPG